ncbi:MAG: FlgO family outer membrane protein [Saprospiraceae bacterium]
MKNQRLLTIIFLTFLCVCSLNAQVEKIPYSCDIPYRQRIVLAVSEFKFSARGSSNVGTGMTDMLTNALTETNCFRVAERASLDAITREQAFGQSGAVRSTTSAGVGGITGAQMIVMGNITEFDENESGGALGGLFGRVAGGLAKTTAHVGMIVKVVNATTGEVMMSKSFDKKKSKIGAIGGSGLFGVIAGGGFFKSKAMADVIEEALIEIVGIIVDQKDDMNDALGYSEGLREESGEGISLKVSSRSCALFDGGRAPKVMVLIPPYKYRYGRGYYYDSYRYKDQMGGENEVIRKFLEFGIEMVDQRQMDDIRIKEAFESSIQNPQQAAELARSFNADIVITGTAKADGLRSQGNLQSSRATVEARAIDAHTGSILATNSTYGSAADISREVAGNKALKVAWSQMANYMLNQLCQSNIARRINVNGESRASKSSNNSSKSIKIVINQVGFMGYRKIKEAFERASWIKLKTENFSKNVGSFTVEITKNSDDLASTLLQAAPGLEISGFTNTRITGQMK